MAGPALLLERGPALDALGESHAAGGILVLLAGEAGVGKTTLLRAFADRTGLPVDGISEVSVLDPYFYTSS